MTDQSIQMVAMADGIENVTHLFRLIDVGRCLRHILELNYIEIDRVARWKWNARIVIGAFSSTCHFRGKPSGVRIAMTCSRCRLSPRHCPMKNVNHHAVALVEKDIECHTSSRKWLASRIPIGTALTGRGLFDNAARWRN